ncbi:MAG: hypothetical protein IJV77_02495 [Clostridia bacterium]|nr:hypothetical protein [Clostridia bacterium]
MSKTVDGVATNYQYDVTAKDGLVAGTILIAVVSDALDNWWEKKKEEWFN